MCVYSLLVWAACVSEFYRHSSLYVGELGNESICAEIKACVCVYECVYVCVYLCGYVCVCVYEC